MTISINKYVKGLVGMGRMYASFRSFRPEWHSMTHIERVELSGLLLSDDVANHPSDIGEILLNIFEPEGFYIADLIAAFCYTEIAETSEDLINKIKKLVANYYEDRMQDLLDAEIEDMEISENKENGAKAVQDVNTGETIWTK